jgi:hypothetical protein
MIEAGAPSTEEVVSVSCARPTGGSHSLTTRGPAQRGEGAKEGRATGRSNSAAKGIIEAEVLHLTSLQRGSLILREDCYNVVTPAPTVGNDSVVPDSKRERGECMLAMLFWVLAALAVVGALAIVWGLYLLARRWWL